MCNLSKFSTPEFSSKSPYKLHNRSPSSGTGYQHQQEKGIHLAIFAKIIYFSSAALMELIKSVSQKDGIAYFSDAILNTVGLDTWHVAG